MAVSVMARIPLLECLTQQSYRETMEKSGSTPEKDSDETEEEKSTDSVLCVSARSSKSPSGEREVGEMTDSGGLRAILDDAANPSCFNVTLLDWINVQDRPNDVESVVRKCFDSINRVSERTDGAVELLLQRVRVLSKRPPFSWTPASFSPSWQTAATPSPSWIIKT